ncbi:hypothetical protein [Paracoccus sp. DMF]|uniref:hypothetical protein n=1 Tax=Paracoccus sp. DMF TaxID=400837 RepID=UPI001104EBC5|nr:hypothetical protein [Paracoccus sp. DMF]MCV2449518.1 hypothetical protein [Paracoccus sp. DMF]
MAFQFAPYQIPPHDGTEDITDLWIEETDAENERGETCEAFFDDEVSGYGCHCALVAIRVTGGLGVDTWSLNLPRDIAMKLLNPMTVTRLERQRADRLDDE